MLFQQKCQPEYLKKPAISYPLAIIYLMVIANVIAPIAANAQIVSVLIATAMIVIVAVIEVNKIGVE